MVKSQVKVYVRTRPTANNSEGLRVTPDGTINVKTPKNAEAGLINNQQEQFTFKYDGVLENVSQESVYTSVAQEVVDNVMSGLNGTIFCYGQTGAGKTFTMSGDLRHYQHRGIIPRAVHQVFRDIDMRVDKMYKVHVSYLEIYNEQLYDLLSDSPGTNEGLAVLEDAETGTQVRGLTKVEVRGEEDALAQFFIGEQGRMSAAHVLNASSSRSHCVFTVHVEMRHSEAASERAVLSKLNMVDLAGSERTKKTGVTGTTLKEAQFINRSLSFLEQTVNALSRHDSHVPYRQCKLTSVLRDALGGNCKTVMVANIWGEPAHTEETLSTLRFASRVRLIVTDVTQMESNDPSLLVKRYERQIKELKQELAMRDTLSGRGRVLYDDLNDAEVRDLNALARRFLNGDGDLDELPTDTLKRIKEMYKQMRNVFQSVRADLMDQVQQAAKTGAAATGQASPSAGAGEGYGAGVGDVDNGPGTKGFGVGTAPAEARPRAGGRSTTAGDDVSVSGLSSPMGGGGGLHRQGSQSSMARTDLLSPGAGDGGGLGGLDFGDRNAAFVRFKRETEDGRLLSAALKERVAQLKDLKLSIRDLGLSVNSSKARIDALNQSVGQKKANEPAGKGGDVLDAEQYTMLQELKDAKQRYRTEFDRLKELRSSLEPAVQALAESRQSLVEEFNKWAGSAAGVLALAQPAAADDDELDAGEAFDRMRQQRAAASDPDSVAFHAAVRKTQQQRTTASPGRTRPRG